MWFSSPLSLSSRFSELHKHCILPRCFLSTFNCNFQQSCLFFSLKKFLSLLPFQSRMFGAIVVICERLDNTINCSTAIKGCCDDSCMSVPRRQRGVPVMVPECPPHVPWWHKEVERDDRQSDIPWKDANLLAQSSTDRYGTLRKQ